MILQFAKSPHWHATYLLAAALRQRPTKLIGLLRGKWTSFNWATPVSDFGRFGCPYQLSQVSRVGVVGFEPRCGRLGVRRLRRPYLITPPLRWFAPVRESPHGQD